jgi:hypothetical protein
LYSAFAQSGYGGQAAFARSGCGGQAGFADQAFN